MINKACPTPAPANTMETPRANGDAGREQLLESPANEMDYINPFCCCSSRSLNIEVTDSSSHSGGNPANALLQRFKSALTAKREVLRPRWSIW